MRLMNVGRTRRRVLLCINIYVDERVYARVQCAVTLDGAGNQKRARRQCPKYDLPVVDAPSTFGFELFTRTRFRSGMVLAQSVRRFDAVASVSSVRV